MMMMMMMTTRHSGVSCSTKAGPFTKETQLDASKPQADTKSILDKEQTVYNVGVSAPDPAGCSKTQQTEQN